MFTTCVGVLVTLWAFIPENILEEKLHLVQFPNRYYILAIGNWIAMTFVYVTVLAQAINLSVCHPKESYFTLVDKHTRLSKAPKRTQRNDILQPPDFKGDERRATAYFDTTEEEFDASDSQEAPGRWRAFADSDASGDPSDLHTEAAHRQASAEESDRHPMKR